MLADFENRCIIEPCTGRAGAKSNRKKIMKTAADYHIEVVQKINVGGVAKKSFRAYKKEGDRFVFVGAYIVPAKTANRDLWLTPNESDTESVE